MIENLNGIKEIVDYQGDIGIRVYLNQENEDYPLHWHSDMEIIAILDNTYTFEINNVRHQMKTGDILIIPSGELHKLSSPPSGRRIITLFDCSLLYSFPGLNHIFYNLRPYVLIDKENMGDSYNKLMSIIKGIMEEYFSSSQFKEASCYSLLIEFFVLLGRNQNRQFGVNNGKKKDFYNNANIERFLDVCNYINDHCTESITVEELSAIAGYSTYHFARLFKKYMNITFYDYMLRRRIMHVEKLLINPEITIMQAALQSGFESLSTFNRVFKKYKNCTPSEFISLNRNYG